MAKASEIRDREQVVMALVNNAMPQGGLLTIGRIRNVYQKYTAVRARGIWKRVERQCWFILVNEFALYRFVEEIQSFSWPSNPISKIF